MKLRFGVRYSFAGRMSVNNGGQLSFLCHENFCGTLWIRKEAKILLSVLSSQERKKERGRKIHKRKSFVSAIVAERDRPRGDDGTINRSPTACHVRSSPVVRWRRGEDKELGGPFEKLTRQRSAACTLIKDVYRARTSAS